MSGNDSDKTVFKQPTPGGERTAGRPTPGGRGANPQAGNSNNTQVPPYNRNQAQPSRPIPQDRSGAAFNTDMGLNPLVNAASTLIAVYEKTRTAVSHPDVGGLYQRLINEIKIFEEKTRALGIKPEIVLSARYLLCSVLDEAVLNTPWGGESVWGQRTLLSVFHGETSGGEKSFLICERVCQAPGENLDIIELFYICLSLGFEGKYRLMSRGREPLEQLKDNLFAIIRRYRGDYERALSPRWMGLGNLRNPITEYIPLWVVVSLVAALLFFSFSGFKYWLYASATPVTQSLTEISEEKK